MKLSEGAAILGFSQFLPTPSATLCPVDFRVRVTKVEHPDGDDICCTLYVSNLIIENDSFLSHSINCNKYGVFIDLKNPVSRDTLWLLIGKAGVMVVNFRSGVAEKLGLDYASVKQHCPPTIYGEITGYGKKGPWSPMSGQDLLVQPLSGLAWLNGNQNQPPTPMGPSIADLLAGQHLAQGILAVLTKRASCDEGSHVHVSMLESVMDMQFEVFTTYLNGGGQSSECFTANNANGYISAPYGIYQTLDGYLATAMVPVPVPEKLISCDSFIGHTDFETWCTRRDEIKLLLADHLKIRTTEHWLSKLGPADVWCADVYTRDKLFKTDGFKELDMPQTVRTPGGTRSVATRCPITIGREYYKNVKAAPAIGQHNNQYIYYKENQHGTDYLFWRI